jgi:hypothetical protein
LDCELVEFLAIAMAISFVAVLKRGYWGNAGSPQSKRLRSLVREYQFTKTGSPHLSQYNLFALEKFRCEFNLRIRRRLFEFRRTMVPQMAAQQALRITCPLSPGEPAGTDFLHPDSSPAN